MTDDAPPRSSLIPTEMYMSDFGLSSYQPTQERSIMRGEVTDKLRNHDGSVALGVLVTVVDFVTSDPALIASAPDWTATQDLSLHAAGRLTEGPLVVDSTLVRAGKKVVIVAADVYDGHGITDFDEITAAIDAGSLSLAARGLVTFARLPRAAAVDADGHTPSKWVGKIRHNPAVHVDGSVYSRLGVRTVDAEAGILELDRSPFVINQIGTIMGGAQAILVEMAAQAMRPNLVATDIQMHFLSQVRVGPARSYGRVIRDSPDHAVVEISLVEAGAGERLLALNTVTLQRPRSADPRH